MPSRNTSFALIVPILCAAPAISRAAAAIPTASPKPRPALPEEPEKLEPAVRESAARIDARELDLALKRGVAILLEKQEDYDVRADPNAQRRKRDGGEAPAPKKPAEAPREWPYEGVYRVQRSIEGAGNVSEIPIGYRVGGTSIAASALIEAQDGKLSKESKAAVERALDFVLEGLGHELMTKDFEQGYDVRGWGHAYALDFLLALRGRALVPDGAKRKVDEAIRGLVAMLHDTEIETGGWNYSRPAGSRKANVKNPRRAKTASGEPGEILLSPPSTFMTAPTLQVLFEAARQGEKVDAALVERGLKSLEDARLDTGAFQYGTAPARKNGEGFEDVPGAIGRMTVCETTLLLAGRGSVERVKKSIDDFFTHWEWLEKRRKQTGTHIPPYMIAPYYFFYAHRYVAQGIEFLPEAERAEYRAKLYALLWKVREESGGWNDRVFPRSESFGTAMTLLALREPSAQRPAAWNAGGKKHAR